MPSLEPTSSVNKQYTCNHKIDVTLILLIITTLVLGILIILLGSLLSLGSASIAMISMGSIFIVMSLALVIRSLIKKVIPEPTEEVQPLLASINSGNGFDIDEMNKMSKADLLSLRKALLPVHIPQKTTRESLSNKALAVQIIDRILKNKYFMSSEEINNS